MPRRLCVMAGLDHAHRRVADDAHVGPDQILVLFDPGHGFGEDTSSSPSSKIFTLTGTPPSALR